MSTETVQKRTTMTALSQIKQFTTIVADTGEIFQTPKNIFMFLQITQ